METAIPLLPAYQYRLLVESNPVMIWRSGADGTRDYFNATWLAFTGRSLEQELWDGWAEGLHPEDSDRCLRISLDHFERREPFEMKYRLRRHDGVYRCLFDRGVPFREDGEFRGFIGSCVDLPDRRESDQARETFLRMMTHELRTPLQAMKIWVEIIRRNAAEGRPYAAEAFEKLLGQFARFSRLIDELSEAGRSRESSISAEALDLGKLVKRLVDVRSDELRASPRPQRHTLVFEDAGGPARLRADRQRLEQAFANLLDNAFKYSPRGGLIRVRLEPGGARHRISVSDEGIGIPRDEIPLVTRRFFRGSNISSNNYPGVGLGLSVANEIVERHVGSVRIESEVGRGTVVTVSLPAAEAQPA